MQLNTPAGTWLKKRSPADFLPPPELAAAFLVSAGGFMLISLSKLAISCSISEDSLMLGKWQDGAKNTGNYFSAKFG